MGGYAWDKKTRGQRKTWGSQRWLKLFRSFSTTPYCFGCNDACYVPMTLSCTFVGSAELLPLSVITAFTSAGGHKVLYLSASARRVPSGVYVCTKHTWAWKSGCLQNSGRLAFCIVSDFITGLVYGGKKGPYLQQLLRHSDNLSGVQSAGARAYKPSLTCSLFSDTLPVLSGPTNFWSRRLWLLQMTGRSCLVNYIHESVTAPISARVSWSWKIQLSKQN